MEYENGNCIQLVNNKGGRLKYVDAAFLKLPSTTHRKFVEVYNGQVTRKLKVRE